MQAAGRHGQVTRALRPCLDCGRPALGSRCPDHQRPSVPRHRNYRDLRDRLIATITTCYLCGQPLGDRADLELDHIIGRAQGGSHDPSNLAPVHRHCHATKDASMRGTDPPGGGNSKPRTARGHPAISTPESFDSLIFDGRRFSC
jgi:5-methylcytosine-specific restriction endonuclease McrA